MSRNKRLILYAFGLVALTTVVINILHLHIRNDITKRVLKSKQHSRNISNGRSVDRQRPTCTEKTNVVFLKVHKTGSSTVANILQRYGLKRKLNFALPKKTPGELRYNYFGGIGGKLQKSEILSSKNNSSYNLLYNHVIFDKQSFRDVFDNQTVYVTVLREPFSQFTSALLYFINERLYKITTSNLTHYLENPDSYEPTNRYLSFTDNRQSLDLGIPVHKVRHRRFINNYIKILDNTFSLVLITEFFDESLILLKRFMCWSFGDIIYFRKNRAYRKFMFKPTGNDIVNYRSWALADNLLYNHFYDKFMDTISLQAYFYEEVTYFKTILQETQSFCNSSTRGKRISFPTSRWSTGFTVTSLDCFYMRCNELRLHNMLYHHTLGRL